MIKNEYAENVSTEIYGSDNVHELDAESVDIYRMLFLNNELYLTLSEFIKESNPDAKQQLIAHNLRQVIKIAKHYCHHGLTLYDLVKEGVDGLIYAFRNFEMKGGFRFAAYARQCIRQNIERTLTMGIEHV